MPSCSDCRSMALTSKTMVCVEHRVSCLSHCGHTLTLSLTLSLCLFCNYCCYAWTEVFTALSATRTLIEQEGLRFDVHMLVASNFKFCVLVRLKCSHTPFCGYWESLASLEQMSVSVARLCDGGLCRAGPNRPNCCRCWSGAREV